MRKGQKARKPAPPPTISEEVSAAVKEGLNSAEITGTILATPYAWIAGQPLYIGEQLSRIYAILETERLKYVDRPVIAIDCAQGDLQMALSWLGGGITAPLDKEVNHA